MTRAQLAALIKAKYPAYKDTPDEDLVSAVVQKYPTYASQLDPEPKVSRQFANVPVDETGKPMEHEPDTYLGGFLKSIKDQVLHATVDNPTLKDAAAPPTGTGMDMAKKLAMLALPVTGDVGAAGSNSGNFIQDAGERAMAAARAAGRETTGVKSALTYPIRAALKLNEGLPTKIAAKVSEFKGDAGAAPITTSMSPGSAGSDLYGIAKSNHEPFTPSSGPGGGGAPLGTRPPSSGGAPSSAPIPSDISSITGRPNAIPGVDAGDIVRQGYREAAASHATDLDRLLNKFGGKGPEFKSGWPPEGGQGDWHSGAEPGSTDAAMAHTLHPETRALDDAYSQKINDPLAALLMSLGIGAGAYGAQR